MRDDVAAVDGDQLLASCPRREGVRFAHGIGAITAAPATLTLRFALVANQA